MKTDDFMYGSCRLWAPLAAVLFKLVFALQNGFTNMAHIASIVAWPTI